MASGPATSFIQPSLGVSYEASFVLPFACGDLNDTAVPWIKQKATLGGECPCEPLERHQSWSADEAQVPAKDTWDLEKGMGFL